MRWTASSPVKYFFFTVVCQLSQLVFLFISIPITGDISKQVISKINTSLEPFKKIILVMGEEAALPNLLCM